MEEQLIKNHYEKEVVLKKRNQYTARNECTTVANLFDKQLHLTVLEEQEKVMKKVSNELHNVIGNTLFGSILALKNAIKQSNEEYLKDNLISVIGTINDVLHQVTKLSFELYPQVIEHIGFVEVVKTYMRMINDGELILFLYVTGKKQNYNNEKEIFLYRICQRTLSLLVRELQVKDIILTISFDEGGLGIINIEFKFKQSMMPINKHILYKGLLITNKNIASRNGEMSILSISDQHWEWTIEFLVQ